MKPLATIQGALSAAVLAAVLVMGVLFGTGVLAVRCAQSSLPMAQNSPAEGVPVAPPTNRSSAVAYERVAGVKARLMCMRGLKIGVVYPIYEGPNYLGRADEIPVDIDLDDQEPEDRIWTSKQHALITCTDGKLILEDLNSANGTFVNRARVYPGKRRPLQAGDLIQLGSVQLKLQF
jgi:hypothetical protein